MFSDSRPGLNPVEGRAKRTHGFREVGQSPFFYLYATQSFSFFFGNKAETVVWEGLDRSCQADLRYHGPLTLFRLGNRVQRDGVQPVLAGARASLLLLLETNLGLLVATTAAIHGGCKH